MRKKILLILMSLLSFTCVINAQDINQKKFEDFKKEIQKRKAVGEISFTVNNKKIVDKASFIETSEKKLGISSHIMLDDTPDETIAFVLPSKKSGTYTIEGNKTGILQLKNKVFAIKGTVTLKVNGNVITGTFSGELFEILKNKSKPSDKSSGTITGKFNN